MAIAASAVFALSACQEKEGTEPLPDGPSIVWEDNENFETQEIKNEMDVRISITAPAGIESMVVNIDSDAIATDLGISSIDFVNPGEVSNIVDMIIGQGKTVAGATKLDMDLSLLVPLILELTKDDTEDSEHKFEVVVTDVNGKSDTKTCTFHRTAEGQEVPEAVKITVSDVDLWANTATVTVTGGSEITSFSYRKKGASSWITLSAQTDGTYKIAPEWNPEKNAADLDIYTLTEGTGIFAGNTYEFSVDGTTAVEGADYTVEDKGDVIPNGDMSAWSTKEVGNKDVPYPNADGEKFWDSGNNAFCYSFVPGAEPVFLCCQDNEMAKMQVNLVLGQVFAPGNMYTGDFSMAGMNGTANFGKVYSWTARPVSLKVSYKAKVGKIDKQGANDPINDLTNKQDTTRIYAVVIDWSKQHGVTSGMDDPTGMWDPSIAKSVAEGAILGYAILDITANQDTFTDAEIPFVWYDTVKKPAEGNYSVVISCATSKRGDYLTGCSTNELWVDNFAWGY